MLLTQTNVYSFIHAFIHSSYDCVRDSQKAAVTVSTKQVNTSVLLSQDKVSFILNISNYNSQ